MAAITASASRATVRVHAGGSKLAAVTPCVVVRTFQRGRFSVVSKRQQ